jgi:hypothetical protein
LRLAIGPFFVINLSIASFSHRFEIIAILSRNFGAGEIIHHPESLLPLIILLMIFLLLIEIDVENEFIEYLVVHDQQNVDVVHHPIVDGLVDLV